MALSAADRRTVKGAVRGLVATAVGLTNAKRAVAEARTEREKNEAQIRLENRKIAVMEAQVAANLVLKQLESQTERYKADRTLEGTRLTTDATRHTADQRLEGTKETADASRHTADQNLEGTKIKAETDEKVADTKAKSDVDVANIGAESDQKVADTKAKSDENVANIGADADKSVAETNKEADESVANINKDAKQYDADNPPGAVELERRTELLKETLQGMVERGEMTQEEADKILASHQSGMTIEGTPVVPKKSGSSSNPNERFNNSLANIPESTPAERQIKRLIPQLNPDPKSGFEPTYQADYVAQIMNSGRPNRIDEARRYLKKVAFSKLGEKQKDAYNGAVQMQDELEMILTMLRESPTLRDKLKRMGRFSNWIEKGKNDPDTEIQEIAQVMDRVMQKYRNIISGAAFGEQEAKEYERLFASVKSSPESAFIKTAGMLNFSRASQRRIFEIQAGGLQDGDFLYHKPRALENTEANPALNNLIERARSMIASGSTVQQVEQILRSPYSSELPVALRRDSKAWENISQEDRAKVIEVDPDERDVYLDNLYVIPESQIRYILEQIQGGQQ